MWTIYKILILINILAIIIETKGIYYEEQQQQQAKSETIKSLKSENKQEERADENREKSKKELGQQIREEIREELIKQILLTSSPEDGSSTKEADDSMWKHLYEELISKEEFNIFETSRDLSSEKLYDFNGNGFWIDKNVNSKVWNGQKKLQITKAEQQSAKSAENTVQPVEEIENKKENIGDSKENIISKENQVKFVSSSEEEPGHDSSEEIEEINEKSKDTSAEISITPSDLASLAALWEFVESMNFLQWHQGDVNGKQYMDDFFIKEEEFQKYLAMQNKHKKC